MCPWCYIGKRRIEQALAALRDDPDFTDVLDLVYRPFQLDLHARRGISEPATTPTPASSAAPRRPSHDRRSPQPPPPGIEFHLDRAVRANTADAHRLLWWALSVAASRRPR